MKSGSAYRNSEPQALNERERTILRSIVQMYILTANPVGSKQLSQYLEEHFKLSPATIRNVMSVLENLEFITHLHTSAGRVPTDKGYRIYVDSLMHNEGISPKEAVEIRQNILHKPSDQALREASKILGSLSRYLSVVELPHLLNAVVRRIQLFELSSARILAVIELDSNLVRTITLETDLDFDRRTLDEIASFLNERIADRRLSFIREHFGSLFQDSGDLNKGLLRLFTDSVDILFDRYNNADERLHIAGTQNLLSQPEFDSPDRMRGVIELAENHDVIIHVLDRLESDSRPISIAIGQEIDHNLLSDYSVVTTNYTFGASSASIGVIGPKRMNYARIASILQCVGEALSAHATS